MGDLSKSFVIDRFRLVLRSVILRMVTSKGTEDRDPFQVERRGIGREVTVILGLDRETDWNISSFDLTCPEWAGSDTLKDQMIAQAPHHIHIQISSNSILQAFAVSGIQPVDKMAGPEQTQLFTRPESKHQIPFLR